MALWRPDASFYPSARMAMQAPRENLGYVVTFNPEAKRQQPDALCIMDLNPESQTYGTVVSRTEMPGLGDELHHFGWNACSAALCPYAPHPHIERRYLLVPGLRSSRMHVIDVKNDPVRPEIVRVISPEEIAARSGYSRPHTIHCGPDAIYVSALSQWRRSRRHFSTRSRELRCFGPVRGRPGSTVSCIRLLVASRLRRGGDQ